MTRRMWIAIAGAVLAVVWTCRAAEPPTPAEVKAEADVEPLQRVRVVVFDFTGPGGKELTDAIRLHLGSEQDCEVVDAAAMRWIGSPPTVATDSRRVRTLMARLRADVALWGQARRTPGSLAAVARCIDLSSPRAVREWAKSFTDTSEQPGQEIARQIVEAVSEKADWTRPQRGDEAEPSDFGAPLNVNGDFQHGPIGWDGPDGVSTFLIEGPPERGVVLKIRTDLARRAWLEYRRALLAGQADPNNPPQVPPDRSTRSVAGTEGVHYCSDWIAAEPERRYWLAADFKCDRTGEAFPRIFVKGFADTSGSARRLPERSLAERNLTLRDFAALSVERRKELIAEDVQAHPERYRHEVYRWYLACRSQADDWTHAAAPFPRRGGLPAEVQWLQVQVYAYWPPGQYLFDNVWLYTDPHQQVPVPQEPPRPPSAATPRSQ